MCPFDFIVSFTVKCSHSVTLTSHCFAFPFLLMAQTSAHNLVAQSKPEQLHSPLAWGGPWHGLTGTKAPTQLLLIQQPAIPAPASSTLIQPKNHLKKATSRSNQPHKNSYLPILNSYPRIAPHPRKEGHENKVGGRAPGVKESGGEGQSQSKRVCTEEEKRDTVSTTTHLVKSHHQQKEARHKSRSSSAQTKGHHSQQRSCSDNISSPSVSSSQTPSPPCTSDSPSSSSSPPSSSPSSSVAHSPYRPAPDSTSMRQRRFLNTAEILNQSGLLAITLRTKELLKQNAATEREIAQLRQHTQYLCQAAQATQSGPNESSQQSLEKLVQAMSESGSYPELDFAQLQALTDQTTKSRAKEDELKSKQPAANTLPGVISLRNIDDGTYPPSPLFAPSPETEGSEPAANGILEALPGHRSAVTDKDLSDLTMLPDCSTNNDYLL